MTTESRRAFIARAMAHTLALPGLSAACALAGCSRDPSGQAPPGGLSDSPRPLRLIAHSPAIAITLGDLGLTSAIVGRHAWDLSLDPALPIVGDQSSLDYEALIALRPTHILLEWGVREPPARLLSMASDHDWLVKSWSLLSHAQVRASFEEFAAFIAPRDASLKARAGALTRDLDRACAPLAEAPRAGRILLLASTSPPAALGPGSFHHEILSTLGAITATPSGGAYIQLQLEDLIALNPDGIVLVQPANARPALGASPKSTAPSDDWARITSHLGAIASLSIPAVARRRVALIDDPFALTPSSAMIGFARSLGTILRDWAEPG
jgi:ABC-type hemin transport system substrate-binding protein